MRVYLSVDSSSNYIAIYLYVSMYLSIYITIYLSIYILSIYQYVTGVLFISVLEIMNALKNFFLIHLDDINLETASKCYKWEKNIYSLIFF